MVSTLRIILTCLFVFCCAVTLHADVSYKIHDLSQWLPRYTSVYDMNNNCEISGVANDHAFVWSESKGFVDFDVYGGGSNSQANAINSNGISVGFTRIKVVNQDSEYTQAVSWSATGEVSCLINLPDATFSNAYDINDNGDILGTMIYIPSFNQQPPSLSSMTNRTVIWHADGSVENLGQLFCNPMYSVISMNSAGLILGRTAVNDGNRSWVRHTDGTIVFLDTLDERYIETGEINEYGQISGTVYNASDRTYEAVIWDANGNIIRYLDAFSDSNINAAYDVNNFGYAVGESTYYPLLPNDPNIRACLWNPDGSITQLDSLPGFEISRACKINDKGWILGECGTYGDWRTVLWEPVPEPSSIMALLGGIGGLAGIPLRRKK